MPVFLSYDRTEEMISALLHRAAAWGPDVVGGIMRGGLVPATMAATILAKPLEIIDYERATGRVSWHGMPPRGRRVLLVDDGCSTGGTMRAVRDALEREGRACLTLSVVHDPDRTAFVPYLSHPMRALWRFPWERGEATPDGRALRAVGAGPDRATEAPLVGISLDGLALSEFGTAPYVTLLTALRTRCARQPSPFFVGERGVLITDRPEADRGRIEAGLRRHGIFIPLECRSDGISQDPRSVASFKAGAALHHGCTHFVERDPAQAILIAALMPHLIVTWWPGGQERICIVNATESPMPSPMS